MQNVEIANKNDEINPTLKSLNCQAIFSPSLEKHASLLNFSFFIYFIPHHEKIHSEREREGEREREREREQRP